MIIGIDLGGTKIAGVLIDGTGKVLTDIQVPTEASKGKERVLRNIKKAIRLLFTMSTARRFLVSALALLAPSYMKKESLSKPLTFRVGKE